MSSVILYFIAWHVVYRDVSGVLFGPFAFNKLIVWLLLLLLLQAC